MYTSKVLARLMQEYKIDSHWELLLLLTVIHLSAFPNQTLMQYAVSLGLNQKLFALSVQIEDGTLLLCYLKHFHRLN